MIEDDCREFMVESLAGGYFRRTTTKEGITRDRRLNGPVYNSDPVFILGGGVTER